ncbi:recE [Prescottella equi]|uniref:PD-(D/E)XK nuclease-like domain-containing protein n=1 Tax=Rhodococcus hoagii TaxID=43767 RepID=UPI000A0FFE10|nr:PD-(D/E)XK nuclease-like domain-containing protein [Prescottella equi]ORL93439.1 recE [Prescottella equi]ORM17792.1 recE [Prescottella equi]
MTTPVVDGIYDGIPDHVYHSDTASLSSSGARAILKSPAQFRYEQDHPRPPRKAFDFGHAAHSLVLGAGAELREIPVGLLASNGAVSTKEAKAFVAEARADGAVALKPEEYAQVHAMAAKLLDHPYARALMEAEGQAEQSIYTTDPDTGVRLRSRPDWMTRPGPRLLVVDYKSTTDADPRVFERHAADFGYHCQNAWYLDQVIAAGIDDDPEFLFIAQSKEPPYLVSVTRFGPEDVEEGRRRNRRAINTFADCNRTGQWPGWEHDIYPISLPKWAFTEEDYSE